MSAVIRVNGRFAKKKVIEKKAKALGAMSAAKRRNICNSMSEESNKCEGKRIVDIIELERNLICCNIVMQY